MITMLNKEFFP